MWLSRNKKAVFLRQFKVATHISAIIGQTAQADIAVNRLGVPASKLYAEPWPVDDRFKFIARTDRCGRSGGTRYRSLLKAVKGLDAELEMAVAASPYRRWRAKAGRRTG